MNNRRKLVIALGAGALTSTFAAFTQQPGKPFWKKSGASAISAPLCLTLSQSLLVSADRVIE